MVSAIVMAGGSTRTTLCGLLKKLEYALVYREWYLWGTYKPLIPIRKREGMRMTTQPMVDFVITALDHAQSISDIVVIGEKAWLERDLSKFKRDKKVTYVQQVGSLAENALEAYRHTESRGLGRPAVFVSCDIPRATPKDYDDFVRQCESLQDDARMLFAIAPKENIRQGKRLAPRKYVWLVDDRMEGNPRRGFRAANMIYINPEIIPDAARINTAFGMRKMRNIINVLRAGWALKPEFVDYYRKRLTVSRLEYALTGYLGAAIRFVEVRNGNTEEDVDSRYDLRAVSA